MDWIIRKYFDQIAVAFIQKQKLCTHWKLVPLLLKHFFYILTFFQVYDDIWSMITATEDILLSNRY